MKYVVKAPIVGLVARVVVKEGDRVEKGQQVAVINSMKTEVSVDADREGTVKEILVKEWDEMDVGTPMIVLEV